MADILQSRRGDPVRQFSVFADNKVGRLHELVVLLSSRDVHLIAMSVQDTTDASVLRVVVDYPEVAREIFIEHGYAFTEVPLVVAQIDTEARVKYITAALVEAEINIHYCYPFIMRPQGQSALALRVEDNDLAEAILTTHGIPVLSQSDIAR